MWLTVIPYELFCRAPLQSVELCQSESHVQATFLQDGVKLEILVQVERRLLVLAIRLCHPLCQGTPLLRSNRCIQSVDAGAQNHA